MPDDTLSRARKPTNKIAAIVRAPAVCIQSSMKRFNDVKRLNRTVGAVVDAVFSNCLFAPSVKSEYLHRSGKAVKLWRQAWKELG